MAIGDFFILFYCTAINIGFEQEEYRVLEAIGDLSRIPIIKENNQESELTFSVIATLTLGSGPEAAQPGPSEDFLADPPVQRRLFEAEDEFVVYVFEVIDDRPPVPERDESFQIQLSLADEGFTNINLGATEGNLFATATVVIIDDDGKLIQCYVDCVHMGYGSEKL